MGSIKRITIRLSAAEGPCWPELHRLQITTESVMLLGLNRTVASVASIINRNPQHSGVERFGF